MAFDGHQSPFANSLFQTYQRQVSNDLGYGTVFECSKPLFPKLPVEGFFKRLS